MADYLSPLSIFPSTKYLAYGVNLHGRIKLGTLDPAYGPHLENGNDILRTLEKNYIFEAFSV